MNRISHLLLSLIVLVILPGLLWAQAPARIEVLLGTGDSYRDEAVRHGIEATVEALNAQAAEKEKAPWELVIHQFDAGPLGIVQQTQQFESSLRQKPDLILIQPLDAAALAPILKLANDEGVPVVALGKKIEGPGRANCLLMPDNRQAGFYCGQYVAHSFPATQNLNIILIEFDGDQGTIDRSNGFTAGLEANHQPFRRQREYQASNAEEGHKAARMIRRQHPMPGTVDVVFTVNDVVGNPAVKELFSGGRDGIKHITIDGDPVALQNIRNKQLTSLDVGTFPWQLGAVAVRAGAQILAGNKQLPQSILLPVFPVTFETVDQYQGWTSKLPEGVTLPWEETRQPWQWQLKTPAGEVVDLP